MEHQDMLGLLQLPQAKAATPQEYLTLMLARNKGYVLPPIKKDKKGKKGSRSKSPGRRKKK
jgi:hypothetical protein